MGAYMARRFLRTIVVLIGVSTIVFVIARLSGDPAALLAGEFVTDQDARDQIRESLGLNKPLPVQYGLFWRDVVSGSWGQSLRFHQPAFTLVRQRIPATLELAGVTFLFSIAYSIPAGVIAAIKRGTTTDRLIMGVAVVGQAWPTFWLGLVLILVFAVQLGWLPSHGRGDFQNLILPSVALAFLPMAILARLTRSAMLDVLRQEYIRTAKAKGLTDFMVLGRHALKNAAIPVLTVMGLLVGFMLTGAVVTETVFAWPGLGRMAVEAIANRDYPIIQAVVFVFAMIFLGANLLVDLLYGFLDPRIRYN